MSLELVSNLPKPKLQQLVIRMQLDALKLRRMSIADIKSVYTRLEQARDTISEALDRADDKRA